MLKRFMTPCPVQVDLLRGQQRTSPLCEEEEDVPSMMKMEIRMTMCPAGLLCEQRLNSDLDLWFTFTFTRWSEVKDKHTWEVSIYPQTVVKLQYSTGETDRKLNQTGRKVKTSFTQEGLETQESRWGASENAEEDTLRWTLIRRKLTWKQKRMNRITEDKWKRWAVCNSWWRRWRTMNSGKGSLIRDAD